MERLRFGVVSIRVLLILNVVLSCCGAFANSARPYYAQIFEDGRFDITIALGFQQKKAFPGQQDILTPFYDAWGTLHRDKFFTKRDVNALEQEILKCAECNFSLSSQAPGERVFDANIKDFAGRALVMRLRMIFPDENVGVAWLKQAFIEALGHDDLILYLGHSRDGDGFPEFGSPIGSVGRVFHKDPVLGWMGFEKGIFARDKYQILSLNSCNTEEYFFQVLRERVWEKPETLLGLILTQGDTEFEDYPETSIVLIRGLLLGHGAEKLRADLEGAAAEYHRNDSLKSKAQPLFFFSQVFDATAQSKKQPVRKTSQEPWWTIPF
ncbi:MAG: hypothetical protein AB1540_08790 [Bdellovibrionota bacterium]